MKRKRRVCRSEKKRLRIMRSRARNRLEAKIAEAWSIYQFLPQCKEWDLPIRQKRIEFGREIIGPGNYDHMATLSYDRLMRAISWVDESFYQFSKQRTKQIFIRNQIWIVVGMIVVMAVILGVSRYHARH